MKVRLMTAVSSAQGSWAPGVREIPDKLAAELIVAKKACKADDAKAVAALEAAARGEV